MAKVPTGVETLQVFFPVEHILQKLYRPISHSFIFIHQALIYLNGRQTRQWKPTALSRSALFQLERLHVQDVRVIL